MQITDLLAQMGGLQSMAQELGVSEAEAASGAAALGPAILGGFKRQAQSQPAGLDGLGGLLNQLGGGGLLDQVLSRTLADVGALSSADRLERRYEKFRNMGRLGQEFEDRTANA